MAQIWYPAVTVPAIVTAPYAPKKEAEVMERQNGLQPGLVVGAPTHSSLDAKVFPGGRLITDAKGVCAADIFGEGVRS